LTPISFHAHHPPDQLATRKRRIIPKTIVTSGNDLGCPAALLETHDAVSRQAPLRTSEHHVADEGGRSAALHIDGLAVTDRGMHRVATGHESRHMARVEDGCQSRFEHVTPPSCWEENG